MSGHEFASMSDINAQCHYACNFLMAGIRSLGQVLSPHLVPACSGSECPPPLPPPPRSAAQPFAPPRHPHPSTARGGGCTSHYQSTSRHPTTRRGGRPSDHPTPMTLQEGKGKRARCSSQECLEIVTFYCVHSVMMTLQETTWCAASALHSRGKRET
jgi:hypothetical protein